MSTSRTAHPLPRQDTVNRDEIPDVIRRNRYDEILTSAARQLRDDPDRAVRFIHKTAAAGRAFQQSAKKWIKHENLKINVTVRLSQVGDSHVFLWK